MSVLDHEDLNEAIISYLNAHDLGKVSEAITQEIKGSIAPMQPSTFRKNTNLSPKESRCPDCSA
jgi:hypothetical protein